MSVEALRLNELEIVVVGGHATIERLTKMLIRAGRSIAQNPPSSPMLSSTLLDLVQLGRLRG